MKIENEMVQINKHEIFKNQRKIKDVVVQQVDIIKLFLPILL